MDGRMLRISRIGYGHGPCNAYDGNKICGEDAEWIYSGTSFQYTENEEIEPYRFCHRHWVREVRESAIIDQETAFLRDHGYPAGSCFSTLLCHLGTCITQVNQSQDTDWIEEARVHRNDALLWFRNWVQECLNDEHGDIRIIWTTLEDCERWTRDPTKRSPAIEDLLGAYQPNSPDQFRALVAGVKVAIPVAKKVLRRMK